MSDVRQGKTISRFRRYVVAGLTGIIAFSCRVHQTTDDPETGLRTLAARVEALLPNGWTLSSEGGAVVVRRNEPVRVVNDINAPARESDADRLARSFPCEYLVTVRLGERLTAEQLADMRRHNREVAETLARLAEKMRHITHKFDDYLPTTPDDERLVKEYRIAQASYREVPRYHYDGFAATVESSAMLDFVSDRESRECASVRAAVISCLKEYSDE